MLASCFPIIKLYTENLVFHSVRVYSNRCLVIILSAFDNQPAGKSSTHIIQPNNLNWLYMWVAQIKSKCYCSQFYSNTGNIIYKLHVQVKSKHMVVPRDFACKQQCLDFILELLTHNVLISIQQECITELSSIHTQISNCNPQMTPSPTQTKA